MLLFKEISKTNWENFVLSQPYTLFVQSAKYIEFYETMGESGWILGVFQDGILIGGSVVVSTHAKRGNFLLLPYGPILPTDQSVYSFFFSELEKYARIKKYDFIRVSPFLEDNPTTEGYFKASGFINARMHVLAENTWILEFHNKTEDELLQQMEKNHRNLIRRCEREGVTIRISDADDDLNKFNELLDETGKRHKFVRFSKKYVENEYKIYRGGKQAKIFLGYLPDGRLDSAAIIMYYGNMACYRQGASLGLNNKLPTSYLLQWTAINEAKKNGLLYYNFWGIAPQDSGKKHPFYGITHFKKGFGGMQIDLVRCQDKPLTLFYWLNWTIESLRRIKRGFA